MTKSIYALLTALLLLSLGACKEQPVALSHNIEGADSTYVTTPETPQQKKVLATELTGVTCPNCPQGAAKLEEINDNSNNSLVIVSIHSGVLTRPVDEDGIKSKFDFRTDEGLAILNQVFGGDPGVKPVVAFNRLPLSSSSSSPYFIENYFQNWDPAFQTALGQENPSPINLTVKSHFNQATGKYEVRVKVAYVTAIEGKQKLNIFLTENNIVDVQQTSDPFNKFDTNYNFMDVFRHAVTGISGQPILDSLDIKEAGRVYVFNTSFVLTPPPNQDWNPANMNVVAFISADAPDDIHVYQSAETKLEGE